MNTEQLYKKAEHADEVADLDLMDTDSKQVFETCYKTWHDMTKDEEKCPGYYDVLYEQACRITKPYADKLMYVFKEKKPFKIPYGDEFEAGFFLSAICNQSSQKEIVSNLELIPELDWLAYRLPADKTFINRGDAGKWMGWNSKGLVVNYGEAEQGMGSFAEGLVINCSKAGYNPGDEIRGTLINFGKAGDHMGEWASGIVLNCGEAGEAMCDHADGIVIALRNPRSFGSTIDDTMDAKLALDKDDCEDLPELIEYLDNIKAVLVEGENDHRALAKLPSGQKIKDDIESILKARGYLK